MGDFTYDDTSDSGTYDSGFDDTYDDAGFDDAAITSITYDTDGDGLSDTIAYDSDGDGVLDTVEYDTDGDGLTDTIEWDTDGDGIVDTALTSDGAGGYIVSSDTDGDGIVDTVAYDLDGDGVIDVGYSVDGGDTPFVEDPIDPVDPVDPGDPTVVPAVDGADNGPFITDDVPDAGEDGIHGDPRGAMEYHQMQPGPVDCLPTSVAMTISEATGVDVPAEDVVAIANEHGFIGEGGMSIDDAATLFESYGLDTEITSGTPDDLRAALDAGEPVIVGIDAADLYSGDGGPFDQGVISGHAVVITGIADGPPEVVYINDPGFADGAGLEIPMEMFEDAWEDIDNAVIYASAPDVGSVDGTTDVGEAAAASDGGDGILDSVRRVLFLPITLRVVA